MQVSGYQAPTPEGVDPNYPMDAQMAGVPLPDVQVNTSPMFPAQPQSPKMGVNDGIETQRVDGIQPGITGQ